MRFRAFVILVVVGLIAASVVSAAPAQHPDANHAQHHADLNHSANPSHADPISGEWEASFKGPQEIPPFTQTFKLKLDGEKVTGTSESNFGTGKIKGTWSANKLKITVESERGAMELAALLKEGKLVGEWAVSHGEGKWEAKKK